MATAKAGMPGIMLAAEKFRTRFVPGIVFFTKIGSRAIMPHIMLFAEICSTSIGTTHNQH